MNKLLTSVLGLLTATATGMTLNAKAPAPRLVIGIHIDQLDADNLQWLRNGFGDEGLKKILENGVQFNHVVFASAKPDGATASASFATGATPRENGITGTYWFDPETGKRVSCIFDPGYLGNFTASTVSPLKLKGSTLGDELKAATQNEAQVYAVGLDPVQTVLLGGHAANGAYWTDSQTGKWCTSTYYASMPSWLEKINETEVKNPAFGNDRVADLASNLIMKERLGRDEATDYLIVQLSAALSEADKNATNGALQDKYNQLDQDIAKLIASAELAAGKDFALYLTGAGMPKLPVADLPKEKAYTGDFYPQRCTSLLNLYLMALYGNEPWVLAWDKQQIFLNHRKMEEKGIDPTEMRNKAASFLAEFSGITEVYTYEQLLQTGNERTRSKSLTIRPDQAADLYAELQGGWNVRETPDGLDYRVNNAYFSIPFIYYKPEQKAKIIPTPTGIGDITASLSRIFRIRPPNDCSGLALSELE